MFMKFGGLFKTLNHFFDRLRQEKELSRYPDGNLGKSSNFRGIPLLTVKKSGGLQCDSCMLCVSACPADCIDIQLSKGNGENRGEKRREAPAQFEIDLLKCVFCGYCEEACPIDGIRMGPERQVPLMNGRTAVCGIDFLAYRKNLRGGVLSIFSR